MDPIGLTAQAPLSALWIPIVWHSGNVASKLAHLRPWTMDVCEAALAAETTVHVLAISIATMHAHAAARFPVVWRRWFNLEIACGCCGWCRPLWTWDAGVRKVSTKATLGVHAISPTTQHPKLALVVPIIWNKARLRERATAWRTWDGDEVAGATEAALQVLPISITAKITQIARGIPEIAHA